MNEPLQSEVHRLCGIEQPEWTMSQKDRTCYAGRDQEPSGAQVALRWIALLGGWDYTRRNDGPYDVYESGGSTLRVKVG